MRIVSTTIEALAGGELRLTTVLSPDADGTLAAASQPPIGEGEDRDTVPDRVVRFLIACGTEGAQMNEIQRAIGGNARTANRQIWTLGTNSPDLPARLRGWVEKTGKGRYALTEDAWSVLAGPEGRRLSTREMGKALQAVVDGVPEAVLLTEAWRVAVESGGDATAARAASDQAIFALLATSKQANEIFGQLHGWNSTEKTAPFIHQLELMGQNYRRAIHAPTPTMRLDPLEYLRDRARDALARYAEAFGEQQEGGLPRQ